MSAKPRVAVVGSGLAGLTAAFLLSRDRGAGSVDFEVHLFEKADTLGMDSSSVSLPKPAGCSSEWRIDVPMRSFQGGYYPQLISLYKHLGVKFRRSDFSYSFSKLSPSANSREKRRITTTMIYNGASGREGVSMPSTFANSYSAPRHQPFWQRAVTKLSVFTLFFVLTLQLGYNYIRLISMSVPCRQADLISFREWIKHSTPKSVVSRKLGLDASWIDFTGQVLTPLFSAVCTASEEDILDHPVQEFLDYVWLTFGTHHYVVTNGVRDVVSRLRTPIKHIHLSSPITAVLADPGGSSLASIQCVTPSGSKIYHGFNHVVFATQANRAVPLLQTYLASLPPDSQQRKAVEDQVRCLSSFSYQPAIVINHTDESLMPDSRQDWRDLNLVCYDGSGSLGYDKQGNLPHCVSSTHTMAIHALPPPPDYPNHLPQVYQTTNPILPPKQDSILSMAQLERAVLTPRAKKGLEGLVSRAPKSWWECACQSETFPGPLQGVGCTKETPGGPGFWFCGSYAYPGIPLLEGCVGSARNVVEKGIFRSEGVEVDLKKGAW